MNQLGPIEAAKAYAALIGSIITALLVNNLSGPWETELTAISIICTVIATWVVPNGGSKNRLPDDPYPEGYQNALPGVDDE